MSKAFRAINLWLTDYGAPGLVVFGLTIWLGLVLIGAALLVLLGRLGLQVWRWRVPIAAGIVAGVALRVWMW